MLVNRERFPAQKGAAMFNIAYQPHISTYSGRAAFLRWALTLFDWARWKAECEKLKAKLLKHSPLLLDFDSIPADELQTCYYGGVRPVDLSGICGTLGRTADFDHHFLPQSDRARQRWVSVAMARYQDIPLPPVELIQVGECYFVKDGHHRISVAQALGETTIDAEVTIWKVTHLSD
jgi:hypothetical protein